MSKYRNFRFTWNNYPDDVSPASFPDHVYLIYGKEIAPTTGTPHLQGHIVFQNPRSLSGVIKSMKGCHVLVGKDELVDYSLTYCEKDGDYTESGVRPKTRKQKGELGAVAYDQAWALAKAGRIDEIANPLRTRYYNTYLQVQKNYLVEPPEAPDTTGVWLWGEAGAGKSRKARTEYPGAYKKATNKWWDAYQGQDYVIIDDVDHRHECLAHHFKIWGDRYAFLAEIKGGAIMIRPKKIIITSQYEPDMIWADTETRQAISRRFSILEIKK